MFLGNYGEMSDFTKNIGFEADEMYASFIPGTVTLNGYAHECDHFLRYFADLPKAEDPAVPQRCSVCLELCVDTVREGSKPSPKAFKRMQVSLKEVENAIERGCPLCTLLRGGIAVCEPFFSTPPN